MITHTYTYAVLEVSSSAFDEIHAKLEAAGYAHAFHEDKEHGVVIDMHGIGLAKSPPASDPIPGIIGDIAAELGFDPAGPINDDQLVALGRAVNARLGGTGS